jgi:WD40 repeat protein
MKSKQRIVIILIVAFTYLLIMSCNTIFGFNKKTRNIEYHDADIIFVRDFYRDEKQFTMNLFKEIGFIDQDGSNLILETVQNTDFIYPAVADDETIIVLSGLDPHGGLPAYWNIQTGNLKVCVNDAYRAFFIASTENPENPYEVFLEHSREVFTFDISTCQKKEEILGYATKRPGGSLEGISYNSTDQQLIFSIVKRNENYLDRYEINSLDMETGEITFLTEGIYPSLSPNHSQIAYVLHDGIYLYDVLSGTSIQLVQRDFFRENETISLDYYSPILRWSPNGDYLLYSVFEGGEDDLHWAEFMNIYTILISDGTETLVVEGGDDPNWLK